MMLREGFSEGGGMAEGCGYEKMEWGGLGGQGLVLDPLVTGVTLEDMEKTYEAGGWMEGGTVLDKVKKMHSGQLLRGLAGHLQEFGFRCDNMLVNVLLIEWEDTAGLKKEMLWLRSDELLQKMSKQILGDCEENGDH